MTGILLILRLGSLQILHGITEPILAPFRRIIPIHNIGIDISPVIAILFLWFMRLFIVNSLFGVAMRLQ